MNVQRKSSSTRFVLIMRKTNNFFDDCKKYYSALWTNWFVMLALCRRERNLLTREKNEKLIRASTGYARNWDTTETSRTRHRYNRSIFFSWDDFFSVFDFISHSWVSYTMIRSEYKREFQFPSRLALPRASRATRLILGDWKIEKLHVSFLLFFVRPHVDFRRETSGEIAFLWQRNDKWDNFMPHRAENYTIRGYWWVINFPS